MKSTVLRSKSFLRCWLKLFLRNERYILGRVKLSLTDKVLCRCSYRYWCRYIERGTEKGKSEWAQKVTNSLKNVFHTGCLPKDNPHQNKQTYKETYKHLHRITLLNLELDIQILAYMCRIKLSQLSHKSDVQWLQSLRTWFGFGVGENFFFNVPFLRSVLIKRLNIKNWLLRNYINW